MGSNELHQQHSRAIRANNGFYAFYSRNAGSVDDLVQRIKKDTKMGEAKLIYLLFVGIGVPVFLYQWFLDITGNFELWKGLVLAIPTAFVTCMMGWRLYIKGMKEREELREMKRNNQKKKISST